MTKIVTGLNVREPYATLIALGKKTIETRSYRPSEKIINKRIAIVATGTNRALVVGSVIVCDCFQYQNELHFEEDVPQHLVTRHSVYRFDPSKPKFGWLLREAEWYMYPFEAPEKTGRIYRADCPIIIDVEK